MSPAELKKVSQAWPSLSAIVRMPHSEKEYRELIKVLDQLTDIVGEDERHPLASLMDVLGDLVEKYEDADVSRTHHQA